MLHRGTHQGPILCSCWHSTPPSIARPWDIGAPLGWLCAWGLAS